MGKRWLALLFVAVLLAAPSLAHKRPVIEYTYVSHIWEEAYETIPKQPVVDERILFRLSVVHPSEEIEGNVTGLISVYRDDTAYEWYAGESYKRPDWLLIEESWLRAENGTFTEDVVIGQPGSYFVTVDWYESQQYIGQSMHTLDVETRTIGPMYIAFNIILVAGILLAVWAGVL